jgi:transcriptional regulator with XRE-family HTH domain
MSPAGDSGHGGSLDPREQARRQLEALGEFTRDRRKAAELSLREMARLTDVSNPYLSQIERGLHEPSVRVLKAIAKALNVSAETLLVQAGLLEGDDDHEREGGDAVPPTPARTTEEAIAADPRLTDDQRSVLLAVYRSYVEQR